MARQTLSELFPFNPTTDTHNIRVREKFKVNTARIEFYKKSAIPYIQRKLDKHFEHLEKIKKSKTKKAIALLKLRGTND